MKITYKVVGISGWSVIYDNTTGDASPTFNPSFRNTNQITPGFGASSQSINPLSNALVTFSVPFSRTYNSYPDAVAAVRIMRATFSGQKVHINVIQDTESQFYPNGSLESMTAKVEGCTVDYTMTFQTQDVTLTQPTT